MVQTAHIPNELSKQIHNAARCLAWITELYRLAIIFSSRCVLHSGTFEFFRIVLLVYDMDSMF